MTTDAPISSAAQATAAPQNGAAASAAPGTLRQVGALKFSSTLGQMVSLLMRTPHHRHTFLADLEWLVLPAIATNQLVVYNAPDTANILSGPAAAVLFATVSPEVDRRLSANPASRVRLKPEEWASGRIPWLVEAVGEPQAANAIVTRLLEQRFKATGLKTYSRGADGKPVVGVLRSSSDKPAPAANDAA